MTIDKLIELAHEIARDKGWWDKERAFGDLISNMHAELSEAWEEYRKYGLESDMFIYLTGQNSKPEGIAVEFADVLIRIFDTCGRYNIPLMEALEKKMEFNKSRSYRHGGKHA